MLGSCEQTGLTKVKQTAGLYVCSKCQGPAHLLQLPLECVREVAAVLSPGRAAPLAGHGLLRALRHTLEEHPKERSTKEAISGLTKEWDR